MKSGHTPVGVQWMATNPFPGWLGEVAADAVVVEPSDVVVEARGNLWTFGLDDEQRATVAPADVEEFVRAVVAARGQWLAKRGLGPMRFYCWHDAQAGQLRFSLISTSHAALPFECPVEPVAAIRAVVQGFLSPVVPIPPAPLRVWVNLVP
ncbi:MAG: hypothetical protein K8U57_02130 [Planctomycetes bacterium]|nr:hypothetical protein [Planctomycetota bacterium]